MKQTERLLAHLKRHGTINPLESWRELGIYRLASRICDLRNEGHEIRKDMVSVRNQFGEDVRFAEYELIEEDQRTWFRDFEGECDRQEEMI